MSDIDDRLSKLSPEKRKLFELLEKQRSAARAAAPAPEAGVIDKERFRFDEAGGRADKGEVREFYDTITRQLDATPFGEHSLFLNYGYVPNDNPSFSPIKLPDSYLNKNGTRLVLELVGDLEILPEHRLLDVGCGRGGTATVLRKFFRFDTFVGVDLSPAAIAFCQRTHRFPRTEFVVGEAESLPVEDASVDVVTNVESSHAYPDVEAFYREVGRVLRPGGAFLYTDVIPADGVEKAMGALGRLGFVIEHERDITSNVVLSCDETAATHARAFHQANDRGIMEMFLGAPTSRIHAAMKDGAQKYLLQRLRKSR